MPIVIRQRGKSGSFELRIKHQLLEKPSYSTWDTEAQAREFGLEAEEFLRNGVVPESLKPRPKFVFSTIEGAIREYEKTCALPLSTSKVLSVDVHPKLTHLEG